MTSVLNHRLLLSGNKWLVIILIHIGLGSCGASRQAQELYTPIVTTPVEKRAETAVVEEKKSAETPKEKVKEKEQKSLSSKELKLRYKQFDVPPNIRKDTYTIAMLLPFRLNTIPDNVADPRSVTFSTPTKIAAEFYQGAQKALDSLATMKNVNLKVHIIDLDTDTISGRQVLNSPPFPNVDVMIGPVYNNNLRIFSQYASQRQIPVFSPMSSSSTITEGNPYYFSANATARTHFYTILNNILQAEPSANIWLLRAKASETEDADVVKSVFEEDFAPLYPAARLTEIVFKATDSLQFANKFIASRNNHLIIPAYTEPFTYKAIGMLTAVDSMVPVRIYGTPKWKEFKTEIFTLFPYVSFFITSSYHFNTSSIYGTAFRDEYKEINRRDASEYTLQGYDLTWYIGNLLAGGGIFNGILQGKPVGGLLQTEYSFAPVYKKDKPFEIDYFDNKFVHWLQFRKGKFIKDVER
jgi:ABC-type branched-subunit amino acid transport system substrate-binding protein